MMKSFFKKLAFVMALAMVVTLAAPAAKSAMAATTLKLAEQVSKNVVTGLTMKVGQEEDLCFLGAGPGWQTLAQAWTVTPADGSVITVDKNGIVKAVAVGNGTVTFTMDGYEPATIPVVVTADTVVSDKKVTLGYQDGSDKALTALEMKVGDTPIDLGFFGVSDWATESKNYKCTWTSSNSEVATVNNKDGVVTPVAVGVATISLSIVNQVTGFAWDVVPVVVNVTDTPVVAGGTGFVAYQTTHIQFAVDFESPVSYGRDDVHLYRIFETDKGDVYTVWAVRKASLSSDKKTLTVEPYVQFGDGDRYLVTFENIDEKQLNEGNALEGVNYYEFKTLIGEIDHVVLSWASEVNGQAVKDIAYTNGEDAEEDIEVKLTAKLYSGIVDLTEVYKNTGYVEYVLENEEQVADYVTLSDDTLVFTKGNITAVVTAMYIFEDKEGEEKQAPSAPAPILSTLLPPLSIAYVKEWSVIDNGDWSWSKPNHTIRAGQTKSLALLLVDNRGGQWETTAKDNNIPEFGTTGTDTEDMYLKFYSTDNDHFLVDDDGVVETYTKVNNAVIYIALHDEALRADSDDDFVRNIGALVLKIDDAAKFNSVGLYKGNSAKTSTTLVTNAVVDPANTERFVDEFTKDEYTIKVLDQDGKGYDPDTDKVLTNTTIDYSLSTTNADIRKLQEVVGQYGVEGLEISGDTLSIDAAALRAITRSSSITATITATQYDEASKVIATKKTTFKITLRDPELYKEADDEAGLIPDAWGVGDVKPTSWSVEATGAGLMPSKSTGESYAKITIPMLSKSYKVGYYNRFDMADPAGEAGDDIYIIESAADYVFTGKTSLKDNGEGIYVIVLGPDNKAVKAAYTSTASSSSVAASGGALGVYVAEDYSIHVNVTADDDGDGEVDYLQTGKYTVKVTFVTEGSKGALEYKTRTTTFQVTDNRDLVKFVDMYEVETSLDVTDFDDDFATVKEIIAECYKFEFDKDDNNKIVTWVPNADQIQSATGFVRGGYLTITSVTFQIEKGDNLYITTTRNINRSVKLGVQE